MRSKLLVSRGLPLMPTTVMPKCLADRRQIFGDQPTPRMPTVLPASSAAGQRSHLTAVLRAHRARHVARQREHVGDGRFRHRRAVDAADIGDHHLFAERGQVDDVVDAGAERLDPLQLRRVAHDVVGHRRRKAQQNVDVGDIGADIVVMADDVDGQLRKALQQHRLVAGAHGFLDFGENKNIRHRAQV